MSTWFRAYGFADVADDLVIGAYPLDLDDVRMLELLGIDRVLNLVEDAEYRPRERALVEEALAAAGIEEDRQGLTDFGGVPSTDLEAAVSRVVSWLEEGHRVYLHCRAGRQRSATVAAGVVAIRDGIDVEQALAQIQVRKPSAEPLPHQLEDLEWWWNERTSAAQ
jgi:atypical dual specificity phosphatase